MTTIKAHSNLITQIDVLYVAPENQQLLLEKLTQILAPTLAKQTGNLSSVWLCSLDGIRIINYSQWSRQDNYDNYKVALSNLYRAAGSEEQASVYSTDMTLLLQVVKDLIEQTDSHLYEVDFIVDTQGLVV
ncbi:MAG: antibiotic biosynthesis monooxygenase [Brasilonema sp.]